MAIAIPYERWVEMIYTIFSARRLEVFAGFMMKVVDYLVDKDKLEANKIVLVR